MKFSLGFLGFFMLIPGLVKFTDPFKTYFVEQIAYSELPFPELSRILGQGFEIQIGIIFFVLVFLGHKLSENRFKKMFYYAHFVVTIILIVALYVHFHPAVPAEILPFEEKRPFLTVAMLLFVVLNQFLFKTKLSEMRS